MGINEDFLAQFLGASGFVNIQRVDNFGLFDDTSSMVFKGVAVSLNVIAEKGGYNFEGVKRNHPCPCGSGAKFKDCHRKL